MFSLAAEAMTPPIDPLQLTVYDTESVRTKVGRLPIAGDGDVIAIDLYGVGQEDFKVQPDGTIYIAEALFHYIQNTYTRKAVVRTPLGSSDPFDINIDNIHIDIIAAASANRE